MELICRALTGTSLRAIRSIYQAFNRGEAIVAILSSIDKKLDEEKKYRDHFETLKNGLMQDLLTGRVRVKVDGNV